MIKGAFSYSKIASCVLLLSLTLYAHIERQNALTALRLKIPTAAKELKEIEEGNKALEYEVACFENPQLLLNWQRDPAFSHLLFVPHDQVLILSQPPPLD